ncbi:hypothetical protein [Pandoraea thiooxydans]|uniref:hypothetical protein n=1 Tax=Pandoraea thiooxydans TaxID=445709 RepID=UPI000AD6E7EF|nr:hypothetical protein [Pandoraea thiooxydans]
MGAPSTVDTTSQTDTITAEMNAEKQITQDGIKAQVVSQACNVENGAAQGATSTAATIGGGLRDGTRLS